MFAHTFTPAKASRLRSPSLLSAPLSTEMATSTSTGSSGVGIIFSTPGIKARLEGTPSSFIIITFFPICFRASPKASVEPIASPSG